MDRDTELFAEIENGLEVDPETAEIDLNSVADLAEAMAEAAEAMDVDPSTVILVCVNAYASNTNLQTLVDDMDWFSLLADGQIDIIKDFLALDEDDQIKSIYLSNFHGISLEQGMNERDNSYCMIYENTDQIILEWIDLNDIPEQATWYLDEELILRDVYPNREELTDGSIIVVEY